ncbi:hypothetical protein ABIA24_001973 [Sinorhizobium fredii]|uniref:hypothetical protein n=1 Tax=Rhizobium fredii TaxID=380 RepID=UPI00351388A8
MANDVVFRPDWSLTSVSGAATIAGGSGFFNDGARVTDVAAYRRNVGEQAVQNVLAPLAEDERADLDASLAELPETIREAFRAELQMGTTGSVRAATEAEIDRFAQDEAGALCVKEWRGKSARNVAIVTMRLKRTMKTMSPTDREIAADWFEDLEPEARAAVLKELGK